jgi:hypothetical protein
VSVEPPATRTAIDPVDVPGTNAAIHPGDKDTGARAKPEKRVDPSPVAPDPVSRAPGRRPKFRERAKKTDSRPQPREKAAQAPVPPPDRELQQVPARTGLPVTGVATELLSAEHVAVGTQCPRCASALLVGQLVAVCPVCGRANHATCWMENHFHCATPDCTGHGSLQEPADSTEGEQSSGE